ncbi:hypothetical protein T03_9618 [Trichinella britovi]|uniref:Uncharacterized protein n=2 Tax=Trichinella TaxID=6333 RepID=A0A0V1CJY3_TRIBR|nr:hypothetical protein T05_4885 [Trichinella murrelli]KRY49594.1 hypothetical protein T03_9618 [Trichinella britovi]
MLSTFCSSAQSHPIGEVADVNDSYLPDDRLLVSSANDRQIEVNTKRKAKTTPAKAPLNVAVAIGVPERSRQRSLLAGRQVLHQRGAICRCHLDEKPRRTMTAQVDTHIIPLTIGKPIHWTSACSTEVVNGSEDQNQRRCERAQQDLVSRFLAWVRNRKFHVSFGPAKQRPNIRSSGSWPFRQKNINNNNNNSLLRKDLTLCSVPVAPDESKDWPFIDEDDCAFNAW